MFRRFLFSKIWSSAHRSCVTGFITQSVWIFHFLKTTLVCWKWLVPLLYQFQRGISGAPALKYFYMIHRGGRNSPLKFRQWVEKARILQCAGKHQRNRKKRKNPNDLKNKWEWTELKLNVGSVSVAELNWTQLYSQTGFPLRSAFGWSC